MALLGVGVSAARAADPTAADARPAAGAYSYERIDETRRDRIEEPVRAWERPTGSDPRRAVDTPAGVHPTPGPTSRADEAAVS